MHCECCSGVMRREPSFALVRQDGHVWFGQWQWRWRCSGCASTRVQEEVSETARRGPDGLHRLSSRTSEVGAPGFEMF